MFNVVSLKDRTPSSKRAQGSHELIVKSMRVYWIASMQISESWMHSCLQKSFKGLPVRRQWKKVLPSQETVFFGILAKLRKHSLELAHVELRLICGGRGELELCLEALINGIDTGSAVLLNRLLLLWHCGNDWLILALHYWRAGIYSLAPWYSSHYGLLHNWDLIAGQGLFRLGGKSRGKTGIEVFLFVCFRLLIVLALIYSWLWNHRSSIRYYICALEDFGYCLLLISQNCWLVELHSWLIQCLRSHSDVFIDCACNILSLSISLVCEVFI